MDLFQLFLVELALAEPDSKNASISFFIFFVSGTQFVGHAFVAGTMETGDKSLDDFHFSPRDEHAVYFRR